MSDAMVTTTWRRSGRVMDEYRENQEECMNGSRETGREGGRLKSDSTPKRETGRSVYRDEGKT